MKIVWIFACICICLDIKHLNIFELKKIYSENRKNFEGRLSYLRNSVKPILIKNLKFYSGLRVSDAFPWTFRYQNGTVHGQDVTLGQLTVLRIRARNVHHNFLSNLKYNMLFMTFYNQALLGLPNSPYFKNRKLCWFHLKLSCRLIMGRV